MNRARGFPLQECADRIRELRSARRRSVPQKTRPCGRMADPDYSPPPELCVYRRHTTYLLHRYFRMAIEVGRLPSLLGREFFRARVSHRRRLTFEDAVIFVHDVEGCLERLDTVSRTLIACIVFQDYSREETSQLLHCNYRTVKRRFPEALDRVTEMFQETGILQMLPRPRRAVTFEAKVEAADGEAAERTKAAAHASFRAGFG